MAVYEVTIVWQGLIVGHLKLVLSECLSFEVCSGFYSYGNKQTSSPSFRHPVSAHGGFRILFWTADNQDFLLVFQQAEAEVCRKRR